MRKDAPEIASAELGARRYETVCSALRVRRSALSPMPALDHLTSLFYSNLAELGTFEEVLTEAVPEPYRKLLAHHEHMTVSVEQHHRSPVDVEVLAAKRSVDYYSRKIILHRQSDRRVVLFGIP